MGALSAYREANPQKAGFVHYLDGQNKDNNGHAHPGPGKDFLVKRKLRFTISDIYVQESTRDGFSDQLMYVIHIIPDNTFEALQSALDLQNDYRMGLPSNADRLNQMEVLRNNGYVGNAEETTVHPVILIRNGKAFDIVDAE